MHTQQVNSLNGIPVFVNDLMVKVVVTEEKEIISFRERWVTPILHPVTIPFEPWVKERTVIKSNIVPSDQILQADIGFIMHPATFKSLKAQLEKEGVLKSSF